jgi:hypothetical protein
MAYAEILAKKILRLDETNIPETFIEEIKFLAEQVLKELEDNDYKWAQK